MWATYGRAILAPSGDHHLIGCCPFHDDNEPSFWVDTQTQLCSCRVPSCKTRQRRGKPMDVIEFLARIEGITNGQAIRELHRRL